LNLLFDLDGTLTNPEQGITGCILHALEALGQSPLPERHELRWCIGPPLHESFRALLEPSDEANVQRGIELYRERFTDIGIFENEIYEEVPDGLTALRKSGHRLWVATSKPWVYARRIIEHFDLSDHFQVVYGSELSGVNTRKADLIRGILRDENLDPASTLMIGDRSQDIAGGLANGLQTIGVTWGFGSEGELRDAGAHHIVNSMSAIATLVETT
jgi:phosphoglycolate phosphatase